MSSSSAQQPSPFRGSCNLAHSLPSLMCPISKGLGLTLTHPSLYVQFVALHNGIFICRSRYLLPSLNFCRSFQIVRGVKPKPRSHRDTRHSPENALHNSNLSRIGMAERSAQSHCLRRKIKFREKKRVIEFFPSQTWFAVFVFRIFISISFVRFALAKAKIILFSFRMWFVIPVCLYLYRF